MAHWPGWSGCRCPCLGLVLSHPAFGGGGALRGSSPHPLFSLLVCCGSPGRAPAAFRPPGGRPAGDVGREAADELNAPSFAWWGPVWSAASRARSAGVGMVGMCVRSVQGLLDRRRGSAADDVCWAGGSLGLPQPLCAPSSKTTCCAAGGGAQLRRRNQSWFVASWCRSGVRKAGVPPFIPGV